jgi:hypothetical protein
VDFLFSLLTLPVGTVVKILGNDAMVGSIGNLYGSVEKLDETYVRSADAKGVLLAPAGGYEGGKLLQLPEAAQSRKFYRCNQYFAGCSGYYTECATNLIKVSGTRCLKNKCSGKMIVVDSSRASGGEAAAAAVAQLGKGFVQGVVTYTVMDDLKVAPMSTISGITLLSTFGITDIGMLQEKTVKLGYEEVTHIFSFGLHVAVVALIVCTSTWVSVQGLKILKASLQSKTVLTDVFLVKK